MKKKLVLILFISVILCGCTPLQKMSVDDIISNGTSRTIEVYNKYRKGYKYNLPKGLEVIDSTEYNETLASKDYKFYLYIDAVSHFNKVIEKYEISKEAYISKTISYEDKYGYLEVNETEDNKYFIEIMYNYAKIEVIVKKSDISVTIANSLSILTSIKFNDNILKTLLDEETSQFKEFEFNIFETTTNTESEYLQAVDADVYKEDENEIHDSDLIN